MSTFCLLRDVTVLYGEVVTDSFNYGIGLVLDEWMRIRTERTTDGSGSRRSVNVANEGSVEVGGEEWTTCCRG